MNDLLSIFFLRYLLKLMGIVEEIRKMDSFIYPLSSDLEIHGAPIVYFFFGTYLNLKDIQRI